MGTMTDSHQYSNIEEIPIDLLGQILGYLTADYIVKQASQTSKHFRSTVLKSNILWYNTYATTWGTRLSKMDSRQDWKKIALTRYRLHLVKSKQLFDYIGPRFDYLFDCDSSSSSHEDRATLGSYLTKAKEVFKWNASCRRTLKQMFYPNLPIDTRDSHAQYMVPQIAETYKKASFKESQGFDLAGEFIYNVHYVTCEIEMEDEPGKDSKFTTIFVLYNPNSGLPVPFKIVFTHKKIEKNNRQWYQDEEPEKPKKEELKLLHMSVLGEEKELILVENNEIYLNTVAKMKHYLLGELAVNIADEVIMSFIWTVAYKLDPTSSDPYSTRSVPKLCYIMSFAQVAEPDLPEHVAKKQNCNHSFIPKVDLPEWIQRMLPVHDIVFKKKIIYKRKGKWCGGRPSTSKGQIDVSKRRMFVDILPQVLRRGPYRMDILERVKEMIVLSTVGFDVRQWLDKQDQSLPEITLLQQISAPRHFFTPADPHGDYGYFRQFRVHRDHYSHRERERITDNCIFVINSIISQKSCDIKLEIYFELADHDDPAQSTFALSSRGQRIASTSAVCIKNDDGSIKATTLCEHLEADSQLIICKFALLRKQLFGSPTTPFSLYILLKFFYVISCTHKSRTTVSQGIGYMPAHVEALFKLFVQEYEELWIKSSDPTVNTEEVEHMKTEMKLEEERRTEENNIRRQKIIKRQEKAKLIAESASSSQAIVSEQLPISAHYFSSQCKMEIIKFVPGNSNMFLINEASYFVNSSVWPFQLQKTEYSLCYSQFSDNGKRCMGSHILSRDWTSAKERVLCVYNKVPFFGEPDIRIACVKGIDSKTVVGLASKDESKNDTANNDNDDDDGNNGNDNSDNNDNNDNNNDNSNNDNSDKGVDNVGIKKDGEEEHVLYDDNGNRIQFKYEPTPNECPNGIGFIDGRMLIGVYVTPKNQWYSRTAPMFFFLESKQGDNPPVFHRTNLPPYYHAKTLTLPNRATNVYARTAVAVKNRLYQFNKITEQFEKIELWQDLFRHFEVLSYHHVTFTYNEVADRLFYCDYGSVYEFFWANENKLILASHLPSLFSVLTVVSAGALGLILILRPNFKDETCCVVYKLAPLPLLSKCKQQHDLYLEQQEQKEKEQKEKELKEKDQENEAQQEKEQKDAKEPTLYDTAPAFYRDIAESGTVIKLPFTAFGMTEKYVRYYHGCSGKKARIPHMYNFVWSEPLQMLIALHDTTDLQAKTLNTDVKGEAVFMGSTVLRGLTKKVLEEQFPEEKVAGLVDLHQNFRDVCFSSWEGSKEDYELVRAEKYTQYSRALWIYSFEVNPMRHLSVYAYWEKKPGNIPRYWLAPAEKAKKPYSSPQDLITSNLGGYMFFCLNDKIYHCRILDLVDFKWASGAFYVAESSGSEAPAEIKFSDVSWIGVVGYFEATKDTPGKNLHFLNRLSLDQRNAIPGGDLHTIHYILN